MKILIADNDEALLNMLSINLKAHGFKVITVRDAVQTWLSVLREVPDLVLLDVHMPGGGGISVVRSMKQSSKTSHIPVLLMTGRPVEESEPAAKECGAEKLVAKPVNILELLRLVERLSSEGPAVRRESSPPLSVTVNPDAPRAKVLVADDDPGTRHMLKSLLTKWDYDVVAASNGQEALRMLEARNAPQLAILDWEMPGTKGIDVVRSLRRMKRDAYVYIILLTSKGFKEDLIEALEAGADDYMVKPFDANELRLRISAGRRIVQLQEELWEAKAQRKAPHLVSA